MFIAIDGDDVGRAIELHILDGQIDEIEKFAAAITARFEWLVGKLCCFLSAKIHLVGGDSILASCESDENTMQLLDELRNNFYLEGLPSISIGTGDTSREAYLALKYAKLRGKNRLISFEEIK